MSPLDQKNPSATRRLDRAIRRQRLRFGLLVAGVAFVILGIFSVTGLFGPPVSSTVAIPKADPIAGLWLVQALPSGTTRHLELTLMVLGVVLLVAFTLLRPGESPNK
jgi:hypothetical protein